MRILFAARRTLPSLLIRAACWSRWSHVGLLDGDHVIDATWPRGVCRTRSDKWHGLFAMTEEADVLLPDERAAITWARSQVGKPHDWTAIVGFALRQDWASDQRWFSSELVEAAIRAGGRRRLRGDLSRVTPGHVWMVSAE